MSARSRQSRDQSREQTREQTPVQQKEEEQEYEQGRQDSARKSVKSASPRGKRRHNKLYRTPPTPPPGKLLGKEKTFVLDCNAVSSISGDYSRANPKLGPVVPPYNSQSDRHVDTYFHFHGVDRTLKKTGQSRRYINSAPGGRSYGQIRGTSLEGRLMDRFAMAGPGYQYLALRNKFGAGHSRDLVDGHAQFMQGVKPMTGYNGSYGFRRNNPWLRQSPSTFGTASRSPVHDR